MYDIENLLDDVKAVFQNGLNANLALINTEKGDSLLRTIDNNAYFFQGLNEDAANFDPFIVYGVEEIETIQGQGFSAENVIISVVLCVAENGVDDIDRIMMRYSRALKETIESGWQISNGGVKISVNRLMPISFKLLDSDESFKAVGINIEAALS